MTLNNNLVELLAPHTAEKLWVALNKERTEVVGTGKTAIEALREAKKKHIENPFLLRAISDHSRFMLG